MLTTTFLFFLCLILCAGTITAHFTDDKTEIQDQPRSVGAMAPALMSLGSEEEAPII